MTRKPLAEMTPDELRAWLSSTKEKLVAKMARERAYLNRRSARGTHTPTDEAYEADQVLEADLLAALEEMQATLDTL
jgi:hypothetical protein